MTTFLGFPLRLAGTGRAATVDPDTHLRDLVLQVLLTEPGERVNMPDFGCGVNRLVFAPLSDVLQATSRFLIQQNIERWLGDRLDLDSVELETTPDEGRLAIVVTFTSRASQVQQAVEVRP